MQFSPNGSNLFLFDSNPVYKERQTTAYPTIESGRRWPLDFKDLSKAFEGYYPSVKWNSSYPSVRTLYKREENTFSLVRRRGCTIFDSIPNWNLIKYRPYNRFQLRLTIYTSNIKILPNSFVEKSFQLQKKKISSFRKTKQSFLFFLVTFHKRIVDTRDWIPLWIERRISRYFPSVYQGSCVRHASTRWKNRDRIESRPNLSRRLSSTEWRAILSTKIDTPYFQTNLIQIKSFLRCIEWDKARRETILHFSIRNVFEKGIRSVIDQFSSVHTARELARDARRAVRDSVPRLENY